MITLKQDDPNLKATIFQNISKNPGGCWGWSGEKGIYGVPDLRMNGAFLSVYKVTWWLKHGYKPQWKFMERKCENNWCVNPDHYTDATPTKMRRVDLVSRAYTTPTFSPEEDAKLYRRNTFGEIAEELAKEHNVSKYTVRDAIRRHCRKEGIEIKSPRPSRPKVIRSEKEISTLWERNLFGESDYKLAKESGIKRTTLQRLLKAYNQKIQDS